MSVRLSVPERRLPPPPHSRERRAAPLVWACERALGFGGFAHRHAAAEGAWLAHVALAGWLERTGRVRSHPALLPRAPRLLVGGAGRGATTWVLAEDLPIARLVEPHAVRPEAVVLRGVLWSGAAARTLGIELELPFAMPIDEARDAARHVHAVLRRCAPTTIRRPSRRRAGLDLEGARAGGGWRP